jgi:hypothetical protein
LSLVRDRVFLVEGGIGAGGSSVDCQALELGLGRRNGGFLLGVVDVRMGAAEGGAGSNVAARITGSAVAFVFLRVFGAIASGAEGIVFRVSPVILGMRSGL